MSVEREIIRRVAEQIYLDNIRLTWRAELPSEREQIAKNAIATAFHFAEIWQQALELHKSEDPIDEETI